MMPPLIDRELLFGNPEIAGAELSPDGKHLAFLKPWRDTRNIWVKGIHPGELGIRPQDHVCPHGRSTHAGR
jgi:hypothetical protein